MGDRPSLRASLWCSPGKAAVSPAKPWDTYLGSATDVITYRDGAG
jgi:hypothetical protein